MWSVDEPGSLDDYEFSSDLGLRRFYRERKAFDRAEWHADTLQRKAKDLLERVDRSGVWTVGTTFGAIAISALDSLFDFGDARAVTLQQILPAWVPDVPTLFGVLIDPATVDSAENTLQAVFVFEFVLRAWSERFSPAYLRSPVALVDLAAVIPSVTNLLGGLGGETATAALRPLRLFRLLRLLRLKEQNRARGDPYADDDSVAMNSGGRMTDKVANVAVEFLCVFLIAGELFYDIEFEVNPNISDVGDALYWSFLTLTGIGQPFEAVTAAGRVATVGSILTALVVVPLQLANLVSESGRAGGAGGGGGGGGAGGGLGLGGGVVSEDGIRVVARGVGVGRSIGAPIASARNMSGEEGIRRDFDDRGDDFDARGAFGLDAVGTLEPPPRSVDPRDLGPMDTVDFEEARIDAAGEDVIGRERERTRAEMNSAFASFDEGSAYEYSPRERARAGPGPGGEEAPERFDEEAPGRRFDEEAPETRFDEEALERRFDEEAPGRRFDEEAPETRFDEEALERRFDEEAPGRRFDEEAPERRFDASAGTRAELRAARARLRAFEREVDALRDENARLARALASVVAKNENIRAEADEGAGSNPGGADAAAGPHPGAPPAAAAAAVAREKERVDERS